MGCSHQCASMTKQDSADGNRLPRSRQSASNCAGRRMMRTLVVADVWEF